MFLFSWGSFWYKVHFQKSIWDRLNGFWPVSFNSVEISRFRAQFASYLKVGRQLEISYILDTSNAPKARFQPLNGVLLKLGESFIITSRDISAQELESYLGFENGHSK